MADAPKYQKFNADFNDYIKKATQSVSGRYDSRIAGEQANIPLIQQQYQNLAKTITTNQQQREGEMKKGAETSIGSNRLANALSGVFSSSENRADERNTRANLDTNVGNLAANVANTLAQAQTERMQQEQAIQNVIRSLQADKESDIQSTASSLYGSDRDYHHTVESQRLKDYWDNFLAQQTVQQNAWERDFRERELSYKKMMDEYEKQRTDPALMSRVYDSVFFNEDGSSRSQSEVYNDIMNNSRHYSNLGINIEDLWQGWRDREYGDLFGRGLTQAQVEAMKKKMPNISQGLKSGGLSTSSGLSGSSVAGKVRW